MSNESLHDLFEKFISEYPAEKSGVFANNKIGNVVKNVIPNFFTTHINSDVYSVKGSVGQGNWAEIPWVCVFDSSVTNTATEGVYIVYLLAKDTGSLYLTFNQGFTSIQSQHTKSDTILIMRKRVENIINAIASRGFKSDENINLGTELTERAKMYQQGTIFYKEYKKANVPDDKTLLDDFDKMMEIYKEVADNPKLWSTDFEVDSETKSVKTYEEFVEGIKAELSKDKTQVAYEVKPGIFFEACERSAILTGYANLIELIDAPEFERKEKMKSAIQNNKIVYFCIDEINRGNIASIFGDLISLIETSKRLGAENEMTVTLPYSKNKFGVPANLKIIGTMNTADRSIQLLDSALRRRFTFVECTPKYNGDGNVKYKNKNASEILKAINNRIRAYLGKDYQIGHTYLMNCETDLDIFESLRDKIIPLLEEYFYGETDKIRNVLNERDESVNNFYIKDEPAEKAYKDMTGADDYEEKNFYVLSNELSSVDSDEIASDFIGHIIR